MDIPCAPSHARALSGADLTIWIGEELTPSLGKSIQTLARGAAHLKAIDVDGLTLHYFHETGEHNTHNHDKVDPHLWLDPENARTLLAAIAEALAAIDPDNKAIYSKNAATAAMELNALISETKATARPR